MKKILLLGVMITAALLSALSVSADSSYGNIYAQLEQDGALLAETQSTDAKTAYVGVYSNGQLTELFTPEISSTSYSSSINTEIANLDNADTVKVFFWENAVSQAPIASYTFDLDSPNSNILSDSNWSAVNHDVIIAEDIAQLEGSDRDTVLLTGTTPTGVSQQYYISDYTTLWEPNSSLLFNSRNYDVNAVWGGETGMIDKFSELISPGDLLLVDGYGSRGNTVVKIGDIGDLAANGTFSWDTDTLHTYNITARESWIYGKVTENYPEDENNADIIVIGDTVWSLSQDVPIYGYEITKNTDGTSSAAPIPQTITPSELIPYTDDAHTYDVPVFKLHAGNISAIAAYRFIGDEGTGSYETPQVTVGLQGNEKYGWIANVEQSGEDVAVKIYDIETGEFVELAAADTIDMWLPDSDTNAFEDKTELLTLSDFSLYNHFTTGNSEYADAAVCKYETNADGKLSKLYTAIPSDWAVSDSATGVPVTIETPLAYSGGIGYVVDLRYKLSRSTREVFVPENMQLPYAQDIAAYSSAPVKPGEYTSYSQSFNIGIVDYDPATKGVGICLRFTPNIYASDDSILTDAGWTAVDHETMIVKEVRTETDTDGNDAAVISGYSSGGAVEYRTTPVSAVYGIYGANVFNNRNYDVIKIWDPTEYTDDTISKLPELISEGDILLMDADSGNITVAVLMVDADDIVSTGAAAWTADIWHSYNPPLREGWIYGDVDSVAVDENNNAIVTIGEAQFQISASAPIDVYEITADSASLLDEPVTAADIITSDAGGDTHDILVFKTFRGSVTHAYIYRISN